MKVFVKVFWGRIPLFDSMLNLPFLSGFDLVDVGKDEVTLRMGKQANRRHLQFALQSLVAVFGEL